MKAAARLGAVVALAAIVAAGCPHRPTRLPALRVGTTGDYPPFSTMHGRDADGLDLEIVRRFARDTGRAVTIVATRWPDLIEDLKAGRFDLAAGGVTIRPERALAGTFTRPVVRAGATVLARPGPLALDQPGFRLAVNAGGHLERLARRLFPAAEIVPVAENRLLADPVTAGRASALLTDEIEADLIAAGHPDLVRRGPFTLDAKAYLGRDATLVAELDAWLRARELDGILAALRARWLGRDRAAPRSGFESDLDALLAAIDLRLAFMPAIAAAKRAAGHPVADPAQEARVVAAVREWAAAAGLDPELVEALFRELIAAGREVQERFVARPWIVEQLDIEREARAGLSRVSREIVERTAAVAKDRPALESADVEVIARGLDPSWVGPARRLAIARALVAPMFDATLPDCVAVRSYAGR